MIFKDRLKALRMSKNLTQEEFSRQSEIGRSSIGMYESGKREPKYNVLKQIAKFFNVSTDYLLGITDNPTPHLLGTLNDDSALAKAARMYEAYSKAPESSQKAIDTLLAPFVPEEEPQEEQPAKKLRA